MKSFLFLPLLVATTATVSVGLPPIPSIPPLPQVHVQSVHLCPYAEKMADAIYIAEGGAKTSHPYGVKSVKTSDPRAVTLTSIDNNWKRWQAAGSPGSFIQFMANRWCPLASDPVGNKNWVKNVSAYLSTH